jgi:hypothetical protein
MAMVVSYDKDTVMIWQEEHVFPVRRDIVYEADLGRLVESGKHVAFVEGYREPYYGGLRLGHPLFGQQAKDAEAMGDKLTAIPTPYL